jgi:hypothetical protein
MGKHYFGDATYCWIAAFYAYDVYGKENLGVFGILSAIQGLQVDESLGYQLMD